MDLSMRIHFMAVLREKFKALALDWQVEVWLLKDL